MLNVMLSAICFNLDQSKILSSGNWLTLYHTIPTFNDPEEKKKPSKKIVEKGENAGNKHFLLFPQCFQPYPSKNKNHHFSYFILSSANAFNLEQSRMLLYGKELSF